MPSWIRALLISAAATGAVAALFKVLPGWTDVAPPERRRQRRPPSPPPTREDLVDGLSNAEKDLMLQELGGHV